MFSYTVERYSPDGSRSKVGVLTSPGPLNESEAAHRGSAWLIEGMAVIVSDSSVRSGWGKITDGRAPAVAIYNTEDRESFAHLNDGGFVQV